jgi:phage FluMu protein Com
VEDEDNFTEKKIYKEEIQTNLKKSNQIKERGS